MHTPSSPSPIVQQIAGSPCRLCGGREYAHFADLGFEHSSGSATHHFEVLVCRQCRRADLFAHLDIMEKYYAHTILRAQAPTPYR
jgi:hypothetical protein